MSNRIAAVVYAKDLVRVSAFYATVAGLAVAERDDDFVVLESPGCQLVVVAIPPHIAADIRLASPPVRREDAAVKLAFVVPSIDAARPAVAGLGGELDPPEREWRFRGCRVCDGHDPEGNVIQLREVVR